MQKKLGRKKKFDKLRPSTFLIEDHKYSKLKRLCLENNLKISHVTRILIDAYIDFSKTEEFKSNQENLEFHSKS